MGCGAVQQTPAPVPQAPTPQADAQAWAATLPQVYSEQAQYMPMMASQQQQIQQSLYPQVSQLSENLAGIANQNMNSQGQIPSWMKQQYQSDMNAQLGNNAAAPIGADYASRGLMQQNQNWQQYYQNLGLSVSGQQPLTQPSLNFMQGYTPGSVMQGQNQVYGTGAGIYGSQLGYNTYQNQNMLNLIGAGIGAVSSGAANAGQAMAASGG